MRVRGKKNNKEKIVLLVLPRPAESLQNGAGFSGKCGLNTRRRAVGKFARATFGKRNRVICPEHQIVMGKRESR